MAKTMEIFAAFACICSILVSVHSQDTTNVVGSTITPTLDATKEILNQTQLNMTSILPDKPGMEDAIRKIGEALPAVETGVKLPIIEAGGKLPIVATKDVKMPESKPVPAEGTGKNGSTTVLSSTYLFFALCVVLCVY